ncbi:DUF2922 domain-containing protein [Lactobacillus amylovorus]|uniref:DUF2922 domain-containing protein n=1 Tax=Lactobacillus amylovorus TaxID=1604 RepID=UPI00233052A0|nr:DUF2922 domain-containing protein [Lactobacillus amylovorus]MDB6270899.1 DUF2922 domain-containing protein [Lactobacillus amylovorus]
MAKTTKTLKLTFLNGKNKKTSVTLGDAVDNLTAEQVRGAMTTIAQANVFEKDGVKNYVTPQSASYIERAVSDIFNDGDADQAESADKQD